MATLTPVPPPLAERSDVHKSCKSLESLLNILNEYCEAVSVVVALQKKLAKVLKETAGLKVTGDNPGALSLLCGEADLNSSQQMHSTPVLAYSRHSQKLMQSTRKSRIRNMTESVWKSRNGSRSSWYVYHHMANGRCL